METKKFIIILLSVILAFAIISIIGSIITGYIVYGNLDAVLSDNTFTLFITAVFSVVVLFSIFALKKR
jgi:uncharacterized membrane protein YhaH (DUF805 family)